MEKAPVSDDRNNDDLGKEDVQRVCDEEATLARAREWLSGAGSGFLDVPLTLDYMRTIGIYQEAKATAGTRK